MDGSYRSGGGRGVVSDAQGTNQEDTVVPHYSAGIVIVGI